LASLALLQARLTAELEALHRSLEQRERAVKELHTRIHQLEEVEVALNHTNATLALKVRRFA
jgi:CII-binding regulator of phage lambda lysogenization HflD